jgi:hypothetical protein
MNDHMARLTQGHEVLSDSRAAMLHMLDVVECKLTFHKQLFALRAFVIMAIQDSPLLRAGGITTKIADESGCRGT